jgi:hypothetical protein
MTTTVNLKKDDVKRILVTFKNLPGYPALNFNKSLLIINNPLITGIKLYRDGIAINGGSLMYSKQMMHSIPGVYKIYAHIPYGYFAPQG